jgi:hypothetical protein
VNKAVKRIFIFNYIKIIINLPQAVFQRNLWGAYLSSAILATTLSSVIYKFVDLGQSYSEFIVGSIAWGYGNKFHDYLLLFSIVLSFVTIFLIICSFFNRLASIYGQTKLEDFHDFLILLSAPAGFWLLGLVTTKNTSRKDSAR